jgi:hypothetical protein
MREAGQRDECVLATTGSAEALGTLAQINLGQASVLGALPDSVIVASSQSDQDVRQAVLKHYLPFMIDLGALQCSETSVTHDRCMCCQPAISFVNFCGL